MKKAVMGVGILAVSAGITLAAEIKNIMVIGWDGAQRDHVNEMIARNELPNLVALAKDGKKVDIDITTSDTATKAGWTQILTGYYPDKTGVYSNRKYQSIPEGYSVYERLEKFFGPENIDTVAIVGKKGHVDADPPRKVPYDEWKKKHDKEVEIDKVQRSKADIEDGEIIEENGRKFVLLSGKPWANATNHMDLWVNGLTENENVVNRALEELEKRKGRKFFFFVHFAEPDHAGHKNGENSQEYTDAIKSDDECTGKIIAKLKDLGLYDKTLVYITADHGFDEGGRGHGYAPYVFLATNDRNITRDGNRADITPTVLKRFGLDLTKIQPALDGIPLDEAANVVKAPATKPAEWIASSAGKADTSAGKKTKGKKK